MGFFSKSSKSEKSSLRPDSFLSGLSRRSSNPGDRNINQQASQPAYPAYQQGAPPPPAYSPHAAIPPVSQNTQGSSDTPYAFLSQFDTVFLIDDSGSMAGRNWRETQEALATITPICTQYDADGVDIWFLNHHNRTETGAYHHVTTPVEVHEVFTSVSPSGRTPTGQRLDDILKPYLQNLERQVGRDRNANSDKLVRPLNIIVITDGVPTDDVESVIIRAARKLDQLNAQLWQVGIQFFQVGNDVEAAVDLRELDDALSDQHNIRDMVDTVPWDNTTGGGLAANDILKVVLGAVHRKYDRRNVGRAPSGR